MNYAHEKVLTEKILALTQLIRKNHPEKYKNLSETRMILPDNSVSTADFEKYLEMLIMLLITHPVRNAGKINKDIMSKDKGTKNKKKAPADKSTDQSKHVSDYKSEGKQKGTILEPFAAKTEPKPKQK